MVFIEGIDDPFAIRPNGAGEIHLITIGISVASEVEPTARHMFSVMRGGEETVDEGFVGVGGGVMEESVDLDWIRRQTG